MVAISKFQENVGFPWNSGVSHVTQLKLEAVRERESLCLRGMGLKSALENGRFCQDKVERRQSDGRQQRRLSSRDWCPTILTMEAVAGSSRAKVMGAHFFCLLVFVLN